MASRDRLLILECWLGARMGKLHTLGWNSLEKTSSQNTGFKRTCHVLMVERNVRSIPHHVHCDWVVAEQTDDVLTMLLHHHTSPIQTPRCNADAKLRIHWDRFDCGLLVLFCRSLIIVTTQLSLCFIRTSTLYSHTVTLRMFSATKA